MSGESNTPSRRYRWSLTFWLGSSLGVINVVAYFLGGSGWNLITGLGCCLLAFLFFMEWVP